MSEETLEELVDEFIDVNELHRFEGNCGLENFEKILRSIGYEGHPFKYGSPIEHFLSDNSAAVEALVEWIKERDLPEWRERVESWLPERDDPETEE